MNDIIAGKNPVMEALKSGRPIHKIWFLQNIKRGSISTILSMAKEKNIKVQFVQRQKLDQLAANARHQGIVAQTAAKGYVDWTDILQQAEKGKEDPFLIILDEIEDPHNLGSIMRTADAVGAHGIIIPKHRAVGLTETVAKASAGAIEYVPVAKVTNIAKTIEQLKQEGVWITGADSAADLDYRQAECRLPLALVIGNEGKGISRLVKDKCDFLLQLPMAGSVASLNASVAASLLLYEVYRKRNPLGTRVE